MSKKLPRVALKNSLMKYRVTIQLVHRVVFNERISPNTSQLVPAYAGLHCIWGYSFDGCVDIKTKVAF